jgi:hypothetical protein
MTHPTNFVAGSLKCRLIACLTVLSCCSNLSQAQVPLQQREVIVADLIRACPQETVAFVRYHVSRRGGSQAQGVDEALAQIDKYSEPRLDEGQLRLLRRNAFRLLTAKEVATSPGVAMGLFELCVIERRLTQLSGRASLPAPNGSTPAAIPSPLPQAPPATPDLSSIQRCLVVDAGDASNAQLRNVCGEQITAIWCIAEVNCAFEALTIVLNPGQGTFIRGIRQGNANTVNTVACWGHQKGIVKLPELNVECVPR